MSGASPMSRSASRRWVTFQAMSRSSRAWWVPPARTSAYAVAHPFGRGSHRLQPGVRGIDVGLLGSELGVGVRSVGQSVPSESGNEISGWASLVARRPGRRSAGRGSAADRRCRRLGPMPGRAALHRRRRGQPAPRRGAAGGAARHAARPAGHDGVGVRRAAAVEAAARRRASSTPAAIAAMDPAALEAMFRDKPALHRYPASMAKRTHDLCRYIVEHYDGRAEAIWDDARDRRRAARPRAGAARASARTSRGSSSACSASGSTCARRVGSRSPPTGRRSPTSTRSSASPRSARRSAPRRPRRRPAHRRSRRTKKPPRRRCEGRVSSGRLRVRRPSATC